MLYKKYRNGVQQMVVPPGAQPMGGISELFADNEVGSKRDARAQGVGTGMQFAGAASKVALRPEVLAATGGASALALPLAYLGGHAYGAYKGKQLEAQEAQGESYNTQATVQQERAGQELGYMDNQVTNTFGGSLHGDMDTSTIYAKHGVNMGNMSQDGVYRLTADFANSPTHEQGGQKIVAKLKSGSMVYPKAIEVEKNELQVEDEKGNIAIIPKKKSKEAKEALANGDNLRMKEIIRSLPKEHEASTKGGMLYAEPGLVLGNPLNLPSYGNGMSLVPGSPLQGNVSPVGLPFDPSNPYGGSLLPPVVRGVPSGPANPTTPFTVDNPYGGSLLPQYAGPTTGGPSYTGFPMAPEQEGALQKYLDSSLGIIMDDPTEENLQSTLRSYNDFAPEGEQLDPDVLLDWIAAQKDGVTGEYNDIGTRNAPDRYMNLGPLAVDALVRSRTSPAMNGNAMGAAGTAYLPTPRTFDVPEGVAPVATQELLPDVDKTLGGGSGEHPGWEKAGEIASLVGEAAPSIYNLGMGLFSDVETEQAPTYDPRLEGKNLSQFDQARARVKGATNLAANQVYGANKAVQAQNAQMAKMRGAEMLSGIDVQAAQSAAGVDARNLDRMTQADLMNLQAREAAKLQTKQALANKRQYLEAGIKGMGGISGDLRTRGETKGRDEIATAQQQAMLDFYERAFPHSVGADLYKSFRTKKTNKKTKGKG